MLRDRWQRATNAARRSAVVRREQREASANSRERAHREEPLVVVEADAASAGSGSRSPSPSSVGEPEHAVVGRQDDVVEAVDRVAVEVERADEAAEVVRALVTASTSHALLRAAGTRP